MKFFYWKSRIYRRLILFFIFAGIVPVLLLSMVSYRQMQKSLNSKISDYSSQFIAAVGHDIEREIQQLENVLIDLSYSDEMKKIYQEYATLSPYSLLLQQSALRMDIAIKVSRIREVTDIYFYFPDGERLVLYGDEGYKFFLKEEVREELFQEIYSSNGQSVCLSYSGSQQQDSIRLQLDTKKGIQQCLILGREIRFLDKEGSAGVLMMRINEKLLSQKLKNAEVELNESLVVINHNDRIISSTNNSLWSVGDILNSNIRVQFDKNDSSFLKVEYAENQYMLTCVPMESQNWTILSFIPCDYFTSEMVTMYQSTAFLLLAIIILIIVAINFFSRSISSPLTQLVQAMKQAEQGNLNTEVKNDSRDEIGQVTRSFNKMLQHISTLVNDVKQQEKQKRKAELDALQAQINPHFLSNTLNIAKYLARTQKADNIENLLEALIELLHITMDMHQDLIPIEDEIGYLKSYVEIMRYRQYNSFEMTYEVQPQFMQSQIPKLILQPIVENAIIHGIYRKNGKGRIIVRVMGDEQKIHISVTDNGQGIPQEKLSILLSQDYDRTRSCFSSIGLTNVNDRIKLLFGEEYGLYIESIYQMYTTVEILIPNQKRGKTSEESKDFNCGR